MGKFRIQPQDIEVPEGEPLKHDLLEREEAVETLTQLINSTVGPCVLAVDAPWGSGKTAFLKIWSQYLRVKGFPVVEINAWETDFSKDPFIALCTELTTDLRAKKGAELSVEIIDFQKAARALIPFISTAVSYKTGGLVNIKQICNSFKNLFGEPQRFIEYKDEKKERANFVDKLEKLARKLVAKKGQGPLIVMIDELDRCRPSFAVEFLETAKHLFAVDQVVFVLAVNRKELAHAVKALYGNDFDADRYLRRFFDIDFQLPEPVRGRENYIDVLLNSTEIDDPVVRNILQTFLDASLLSLRDIAQAVHRIGLVLNSLSGKREAMAHLISIALILRTLNETLYNQFVRGEVTDVEVAKEIFAIPSISLRRYEPDGFLFQIGLAQAYRELSASPPGRKTPLEGEIERRLEGIKNNAERELIENSRKYIIELLEDNDATATDFRDAIRHIELLSSDPRVDT